MTCNITHIFLHDDASIFACASHLFHLNLANESTPYPTSSSKRTSSLTPPPQRSHCSNSSHGFHRSNKACPRYLTRQDYLTSVILSDNVKPTNVLSCSRRRMIFVSIKTLNSITFDIIKKDNNVYAIQHYYFSQ